MKNVLKQQSGFTLVELMVVIVIVGILAAVAIPKFMDASHKAKASEFPTQLTAIYTGQQARMAEVGSFAATLTELKTGSGVDIDATSKWFTYATVGTATTFTGTATVSTDFGDAKKDDKADIDNTGKKTASASLTKYVPSWPTPVAAP